MARVARATCGQLARAAPAAAEDGTATYAPDTYGSERLDDLFMSGNQQHLCPYVVRPLVAQDAWELTREARVLVRLRRPWRDGTRAVRFAPSELLEQRAASPPAGHARPQRGTSAPATSPGPTCCA